MKFIFMIMLLIVEEHPTDFKDYVVSDVLPLNHALIHTNK